MCGGWLPAPTHFPQSPAGPGMRHQHSPWPGSATATPSSPRPPAPWLLVLPCKPGRSSVTLTAPKRHWATTAPQGSGTAVPILQECSRHRKVVNKIWFGSDWAHVSKNRLFQSDWWNHWEICCAYVHLPYTWLFFVLITASTKSWCVYKYDKSPKALLLIMLIWTGKLDQLPLEEKSEKENRCLIRGIENGGSHSVLWLQILILGFCFSDTEILVKSDRHIPSEGLTWRSVLWCIY